MLFLPLFLSYKTSLIRFLLLMWTISTVVCKSRRTKNSIILSMDALLIYHGNGDQGLPHLDGYSIHLHTIGEYYFAQQIL